MADSIQSLSDLSDEELRRLAKTPIVEPPKGVSSNFDDPPSRAALQIWTTSVFLAIVIILCTNRLYVKTRLMRTWSLDDVTLFVAVALAIAQYGVMTEGVTQGFMGRHLWDISVAQMLSSRLPPIAYTIMILTPWTLLFLKITFFVLYLHLFSRIRWVRISSWAGICFVVLGNGAVGIYAFAIANPHENASWADKATRLSVPIAILSLVADVIIFIIPFAAIIPLQISQAKRVGALLIFLTGGSAIICSTINLYYRYQLQQSSDIMWDSVLCSIFSLCEILLGITCACLPTAAYGFRHKGSVYHRVLHPSHYNTSKQRNSTILALTPRPRSGAADAESLNSRSRIRCTTCVEISTSEPDSDLDLDGKGILPSIEEVCKEGHGNKTVELRALEPVHLPVPDADHRRV